MSFSVPYPLFARRIVPLALALWAACPAHGQTRAAQDQQNLINWYYSATFGTGVYTAGDRTVTVIQLPISRLLRPADEEHYGMTLKVPITFGFYDYSFDDALSAQLPEKLNTVSVMPGLEWEMPLTSRWTLKPYFSGGAGHELDGKESALIYDFGIKSRFVLGVDEGVEFALVNSLTAAGYKPRGSGTQPFGVFVVGFDLVIPTNKVLFGRDAFIGFTPIYYYYFKEIKLDQFDNEDNRLREQFEIAVSIMSRKPWTLKYFDVDRVGLALRSSSGVTGVSLFTSLPF